MSTRVTAGVTDCFYGLKLNIVKNVAMTGGGGSQRHRQSLLQAYFRTKDSHSSLMCFMIHMVSAIHISESAFMGSESQMVIFSTMDRIMKEHCLFLWTNS